MTIKIANCFCFGPCVPYNNALFAAVCHVSVLSRRRIIKLYIRRACTLLLIYTGHRAWIIVADFLYFAILHDLTDGSAAFVRARKSRINVHYFGIRRLKIGLSCNSRHKIESFSPGLMLLWSKRFRKHSGLSGKEKSTALTIFRGARYDLSKYYSCQCAAHIDTTWLILINTLLLLKYVAVCLMCKSLRMRFARWKAHHARASAKSRWFGDYIRCVCTSYI